MAIRRFSSSRVTRKEDYSSFAATAKGELVWAQVSATTGSPATGSYVSGDDEYDYYKFTGAGTITFSKGGVADVMVVAGGAGGRQFTYSQGREYPDTMRQNSAGGSGGVVWKLVEVEKDQTVIIQIGAGGNTGIGAASKFGELSKIGGGQDTSRGGLGAHGGGGQQGVVYNNRDGDPTLYGGGFGGNVWGNANRSGVVLSYDNSAIEYGVAGGGAAQRGNSGGPGNQAGGSGIVIVRIKK